VAFLQNHDQIGNRALGERLHQLCSPQALKAATTLLLLSPMIPLMFMGDEVNARDRSCSSPTTTANSPMVREGRRNEFADFAAFHDPERRERIPDPNALSTFAQSAPTWADNEHTRFYRQLLSLRHRHIVPHLPGT
jgi:maltooligosyltrehalose trehalohydrolase